MAHPVRPGHSSSAGAFGFKPSEKQCPLVAGVFIPALFLRLFVFRSKTRIVDPAKGLAADCDTGRILALSHSIECHAPLGHSLAAFDDAHEGEEPPDQR